MIPQLFKRGIIVFAHECKSSAQCQETLLLVTQRYTFVCHEALALKDYVRGKWGSG